MAAHKIIIRSNLDNQENQPPQLPGKFQLMMWGIGTVLGLSVLSAFLLASFIIGLLLVIPFIILGILWLLTLVWRGKIRIRRGHF